MPNKSVKINPDDIDEVIISYVYFKCPYCNYGNDLEWVHFRPESCKCARCKKTINIKLGQEKK